MIVGKKPKYDYQNCLSIMSDVKLIKKLTISVEKKK